MPSSREIFPVGEDLSLHSDGLEWSRQSERSQAIVVTQNQHPTQPRDQGALPEGGDTLTVRPKNEEPFVCLISAVLGPQQLFLQFIQPADLLSTPRLQQGLFLCAKVTVVTQTAPIPASRDSHSARETHSSAVRTQSLQGCDRRGTDRAIRAGPGSAAEAPDSARKIREGLLEKEPSEL